MLSRLAQTVSRNTLCPLTKSSALYSQRFFSTFSLTKNYQQLQGLIQLHCTRKPVIEDRTYIENGSYPVSSFFPFSNEAGFNETIASLSTPPTKSSPATRAAFLIGESHILSSLPELKLHADVIICNDIEPLVSEHIKHMLQCLLSSPTRDEFITAYQINNPIAEIFFKDVLQSSEDVVQKIKPLKELKTAATSTAEKHFLFSDARYLQCRTAAQDLFFVYSRINMFNEQDCQSVGGIIQQTGLQLNVINLSNLHHYDTSNVLNDHVEKYLAREQTKMLFSHNEEGQFHLVSFIQPDFQRYKAAIAPATQQRIKALGY